MTLFTRLHDDLFRPLAGPNRHVFNAILARLHELFFGGAVSATFPTDKSVRTEIEEVMATHALRDWVPEEDDETLPDLPANTAGNAWRAYRRLLRCGWLEDETDGYQVRVIMPPDIGHLLSALMDIASQRSRLYGGMVQSIHNNIRHVRENPAEQAAALTEAARVARDFSLHLRSIAYGLRELGRALRDIRDPRRLLGSFFSDFVEHYLVADYKTLHTQENPFRYRAEILRMVRELRFSQAAKEILPPAYQRLGIATLPGDALLRVDADLQLLQQVFEEVDEHLSRIDAFRTALERRVAESVRYLDKTRPGAAARLAQVVEHLAAGDDDRLAALPPAHGLIHIVPLSARSPRPPATARRPPEPQRLRIRVPDPAALEMQRRVREYLGHRRLDPRRIEVYLDAWMQGRWEIAATELPIKSVEDFVSFAHLRHLSYLGEPGSRLRRHYEVNLGDTSMENDWLRCRNFTIRRRT